MEDKNLLELSPKELHEKLITCHGVKAKATIKPYFGDITTIEGKVSVDDYGVYMCQNKLDGLYAKDRFGYQYSWIISKKTTDSHEHEFGLLELWLLSEDEDKDEIKQESAIEIEEGEVYAVTIDGDDWLFRPNGKSTDRDVFCYSSYAVSDDYWVTGDCFWESDLIKTRKATDEEKAQLAEKEAENGMYYCSQNKLMLKQGEYYISESGEIKWVLRFNKALQDDVYAESYCYNSDTFYLDEDCPFSYSIDRNKLRKATDDEIATFEQKEAEYEAKKVQKELLSHGEPSWDIKIDPKLMEASNACTETDTRCKVKDVEKTPKGERILKLSEKLAELAHHVMRGDEIMKELNEEFNFKLNLKDNK